MFPFSYNISMQCNVAGCDDGDMSVESYISILLEGGMGKGKGNEWAKFHFHIV